MKWHFEIHWVWWRWTIECRLHTGGGRYHETEWGDLMEWCTWWRVVDRELNPEELHRRLMRPVIAGRGWRQRTCEMRDKMKSKWVPYRPGRTTMIDESGGYCGRWCQMLQRGRGDRGRWFSGVPWIGWDDRVAKGEQFLWNVISCRPIGVCWIVNGSRDVRWVVVWRVFPWVWRLMTGWRLVGSWAMIPCRDLLSWEVVWWWNSWSSRERCQMRRKGWQC